MKLEFVNPGFSYSLDSMMLFEESNQSDWWRDANFYFYPMLKKEELRALPMSERRAYYQSKLEPFWVEKADGVCRKAGSVERALAKARGRDCAGAFRRL